MTRPMNRPLALAVLLCAAPLASCDKNTVQELPLAPVPTARIKFFNFGLNAPAVNFYANDTKMTAITSISDIESTSGVAYSQAGNGGLYSALAPGTYTLTGRIAAATNKDLPIDNLSATIADGKSYSFYLSGLYDTTAKQVDAFVVPSRFARRRLDELGAPLAPRPVHVLPHVIRRFADAPGAASGRT